MERHRVLAGLRQQRLVQPVGARAARACARRRLLVAHAHPHVGVHRVRAAHGVLGRDRAARPSSDSSGGEATATSTPASPPSDQKRAGHVVAVAHVGQPQPLEPAEALAERQQVGQRLAGVVVAREHVHHRDRRRARPAPPRPRAGPVRTPTACTIRDRTSARSRSGLAPRHLQLVRLAGPAGGRPARARPPRRRRACAWRAARRRAPRCLPSSARDASRSRLQLQGAVHEPVQLVRRKLRAGQEVPSQCESSAGTSTTAATSPPTRPSSPRRSRLLRADRAQRHARAGEPPAAAGVRATGSTAGDWDVALLQEAPPRWFRRARPAHRARAARSPSPRATSLPALQWRLADLNPDLLASSDGGSNQILVRHPGRIAETRRLRLAAAPRAAPDAVDAGGAARGPRVRGEPARERGPSRGGRRGAASAPPSARVRLGRRRPAGARRRPQPAPAPATRSRSSRLRERFGLGEPTAPGGDRPSAGARPRRSMERPRRLRPSERELTEPRRAAASGSPITLPSSARFGLP